jgi:membrane associated rhomboid family serine protease
MTEAEPEAQRLRRAFFAAAAFAGLLWLIKLAELIFSLDLWQLSVFPRRVETLPGIALAPLLHRSLSHLFANTAPLLVLGTLLFYGYPKAARILLPAVYLGSGLGVWLFARPAWHLGASGLTFGMMFFVFTVGIMRWDRRAIALALVAFFLYGGMIWGIFPTAPDVSFEYHLFGAGIGVFLAFVLKGLDPPPEENKYGWEGEDGDDDWPFEEELEEKEDRNSPFRAANRLGTSLQASATHGGLVSEIDYFIYW